MTVLSFLGQISTLVELWELYCKNSAYGQDKRLILTSLNYLLVQTATHIRWGGIVVSSGLEEQKKPSRYLGIDMGNLKEKRMFFRPMMDKFKQKLVGWKSQLLSQGGRLTLIKSTLANPPNYTLSCFKTLAFIYKKTDQTIRGF